MKKNKIYLFIMVMAIAVMGLVGCVKDVPVTQVWKDTTNGKMLELQIRNDNLTYQLSGTFYNQNGKLDKAVTKAGKYKLGGTVADYEFIVNDGVKTGKIGPYGGNEATFIEVKRIN